nr:protein translocase subunit SecA-like [Lytechinus pictus]
MKATEKEKSYNTDIIYITNSEIGFDYLRDNMLDYRAPKLQKNFHFAIVDEADSILIDEARTPLVISGDPINRADLHFRIDDFTLSLKKTDYVVELEHRRCFLSEYGVKKACAFFGIEDFYRRENSETYHHLNNSLFAHFILQKNVDYLVRNNKIMLIDHFTGRVLENRSFSDGLHQALEAKERINISSETSVLATITYQNFFRLFDNLAGITGTAASVKNEFIATYNMHVVQIPTNMPLIRKDEKDLFFYNKKAKYLAIVAEIKRFFDRGQPVLVGTNSVSTSEDISHILKNMKIPHKVLSAKHHIYEAQVVAQAGFFKSVTIATNMAGRGTDIKLDERAKAHGGLVMLGAEKNESRRIDLQLRGRSGRQGEPGRTQFFVSLDDDIFMRFGNESFKKQFAKFQFETIHSKLLSWGVEKFQKKLTQSSYEQRKTLLEYDNVISQQRRIIYHQRDFFRVDKDFAPYIADFLEFFIRVCLNQIVKNRFSINDLEKSRIREFIAPFKFDIEALKEGESKNLTQEWVENELNQKIKLLLTEALEKFPKEIESSFRSSLTTVIDKT